MASWRAARGLGSTPISCSAARATGPGITASWKTITGDWQGGRATLATFGNGDEGWEPRWQGQVHTSQFASCLSSKNCDNRGTLVDRGRVFAFRGENEALG
jgi:hypothetical protein